MIIKILSKTQNLYLKKHPDNHAFEKQELQLPRRLSAFKTFSRTRTRLKSRIKNDQHHFFDTPRLLDIITKNVLLSSFWWTSFQDGSNSEDGNNLEAHMAKVRLDATQKVWQCFKSFSWIWMRRSWLLWRVATAISMICSGLWLLPTKL